MSATLPNPASTASRESRRYAMNSPVVSACRCSAPASVVSKTAAYCASSPDLRSTVRRRFHAADTSGVAIPPPVPSVSVISRTRSPRPSAASQPSATTRRTAARFLREQYEHYHDPHATSYAQSLPKLHAYRGGTAFGHGVAFAVLTARAAPSAMLRRLSFA